MKRIAMLLLCMLLLTGCTSTAAERMQTAAAPVDETTAESAPTVLTREEQANLLYQKRNLWLAEEIAEHEPYFYTFTDLNRNGQLEVIGAVTVGTGIYTTGRMFEVTGDTLTKITLPENDILPEVILRKTICCYDAESDCYNYTFSDYTRNGAAENWTTLNWLSLDGAELSVETIAWSHFQCNTTTFEESCEYADTEGPLTEAGFNRAVEKAGAGMQMRSVSLEWKRKGEITSSDDILRSVRIFLGEDKLPRDKECTDIVYPEGIPEEIVCSLFEGDGYSVYIPQNDWVYSKGMVSGEGADIWTSPLLEEIQMKIVKLPGINAAAARAWAMQQHSGYDINPDQCTGRSGGDFFCYSVFDSGSASYVILKYYPMEALEGAGTRMEAMTASFELD